MRLLNKTLAGALLVILGVTASVYGTQQLFSHVIPGVPANVAVLSPLCSSTSILAAPASVAPGSSGGVFFGCGNGTAVIGPSFKVAADGAAIPTFTLPTPYTGVSLTTLATPPPPDSPGCTSSTGPLALTSGTAFSFTGTNGKGNQYYYCVTYAIAPATGLPSFTILWTQ